MHPILSTGRKVLPPRAAAWRAGLLAAFAAVAIMLQARPAMVCDDDWPTLRKVAAPAGWARFRAMVHFDASGAGSGENLGESKKALGKQPPRRGQDAKKGFE